MQTHPGDTNQTTPLPLHVEQWLYTPTKIPGRSRADACKLSPVTPVSMVTGMPHSSLTPRCSPKIFRRCLCLVPPSPTWHDNREKLLRSPPHFSHSHYHTRICVSYFNGMKTGLELDQN